MKKNILYAALFALTTSTYALGLGGMTVESSLDQPFKAEIELIDVSSAVLGSIKVGLADPENFERLDIQPVAALSLLTFNIEKNNRGKFVIKVQSTERMSEPYMRIVIDLIWPEGQLYKAYTVLLDPPGYKLVSSLAQSSPTYYKQTAVDHEPGVIDKTVTTVVTHNHMQLNDMKKKALYGPTIINENVWQIAQRYKASELLLPQVVLAIVGANPDAFTDGNLNGLKVGVQLIVPATKVIQQVPSDLATEEVMAHDKAWNEKTTINHVITPPYLGTSVMQENLPKEQSVVPAIPQLPDEHLTASDETTILPAINQVQTPDLKSTKADTFGPSIAKITEAVKKLNSQSTEEFREVQDENKKLQQQLDQRDKDIDLIRKQMQILMKEKQAGADKISVSSPVPHASNFWLFTFLLLIAAGGGGTYYWYVNHREQEAGETSNLEEAPVDAEHNHVINTDEDQLGRQQELHIEEAHTDSVVEFLSSSQDVPETSSVPENKIIQEVTDSGIDYTKTDIETSLQLEQPSEVQPKDSASEPSALEFFVEPNEEATSEVAEPQQLSCENDKTLTNEYGSNSETKVEANQSIELQNNVSDTVLEVDDNNETSNPLKSKQAFDTLLALAKTYISMGDFESAKYALNEVLEHGSESQQEEAKPLLEEIKDK
ncbi:MAG: FimV/HubP family polar landmark protein [Legionellales bacterium]